MTKRERIQCTQGIVAAVGLCWLICFLGWLMIELFSTVRRSLPLSLLPFMAVVVCLGALVLVFATGATMGFTAAFWWKDVPTGNRRSTGWCFLTCLLAYAGGFVILGEEWTELFLPVYPLLTWGMWWGLAMGLRWIPRQPWRSFLGQEPLPLPPDDDAPR
jgi:hypothetical protein